MSDGPHRSLNMRRGWKQLAERADNRAFAPEAIRDALPKALEQDWRAEVPESLPRQIRTIFEDTQSSLFEDEKIERLEALRSYTAGYPLSSVFLDCAIQAAAKGRTGEAAVSEAACDALKDRAARGALQVEEHFYRKTTENRAARVRERIESGISQSDVSGIARRLIETGKSEQPRTPAKQTDLDDGVQF